jgi:hypothetical protein
VANLSHPVPADDATYLADRCDIITRTAHSEALIVRGTGYDVDHLADSFDRFLGRRAAADDKPFLAFLAYHNNHIPYVATAKV